MLFKLLIFHQALQRLFESKMSLTDSTHSHSNQVKMNKHSEGSHSAPLQAKVFGQTSTNAPRAALGNITNNVKTTTREALKPLKAVQPTNRVQVYKVRHQLKEQSHNFFQDVDSKPTVGPKETAPSVPAPKETVSELSLFAPSNKYFRFMSRPWFPLRSLQSTRAREHRGGVRSSSRT